MPGGRPRKPVAQKLMEGTFRADRDGDPSLLVPSAGSPEPPSHLSGEALAFWWRVVPDLAASRIATERDSAELAIMCEWWARYRRYSDEVDGLNPQDKAAYQLTVLCGICCTNFDRVASKFGLNPSDRSKLRVDPATAPRRVESRRRG